MARQRLDAQESRNIILDAVERLMQREGYARVNTRTVAKEAGLKPTLVHYHFNTTENLLAEAYRRCVAKSETTLRDILASKRPLHSLWEYNSDPVRTALAIQFMALASHNQTLGVEIGANVERFRLMQEAAVERSIEGRRLEEMGVSAAAAAMLVAAIGRAFILESSIGVANGHSDLKSLVEQLIGRCQSDCTKPKDWRFSGDHASPPQTG